jgi:hypothetical protein
MIIMTHFPGFKEKHGSGIKSRKVPDESIKLYKDLLPSSLIGNWREEGWCGYAKGLIWTVDPSEFQSVLSYWIEPSSLSIVFARTAFGDMVVWDGQTIKYVSVIYNQISELTKDMEMLFEYIFCDDDYLKDALDLKLYRSALKKLGQLESDECYGFEPALALGGSGELDTLKKSKLREYIGILAQLS